MKRFLILITILFVLSGTQAMAATSIALDSVANKLGQASDSVIKAGDTVKFYFRFTNSTDTGWNVTNAFIISSPDGATWTDSATGNYRGSNLGPIGVDTLPGFSPKTQFNAAFFIRSFSGTPTPGAKADGLTPDTVSFSGAGNDIGLGLPPQSAYTIFTIRLRPKLAEIGKHICIDSAMRFYPTNVWKWAALYQTSGDPVGGQLVLPTWSGKACFRIDTTTATGVNITPGDGLPKVFALMQNYPNPFNPSTQINFELPERAHVTLKIYNLLGQEVTELVNEEMAAGRYTADWDGSRVASGVYFYKIEAGNFVQTKKMVLMK